MITSLVRVPLHPGILEQLLLEMSWYVGSTDVWCLDFQYAAAPELLWVVLVPAACWSIPCGSGSKAIGITKCRANWPTLDYRRSVLTEVCVEEPVAKFFSSCQHLSLLSPVGTMDRHLVNLTWYPPSLTLKQRVFPSRPFITQRLYVATTVTGILTGNMVAFSKIHQHLVRQSVVTAIYTVYISESNFYS